MKIDQKGQAILILILVMTVALAIGLSIVQRSLVDISTASKVEQSSRAFSAAEAGIEKALTGSANLNCTSQTDDVNCQSFTETSSTIKEITDTGFPAEQITGNQQPGLEYPPMGKEDVAQFWLADLNSTTNNPPTEFYMPATKTTNRGIEIYWGNPNAEKAAISVKIIYHNGSAYTTAGYFFDPDSTRSLSNGFVNVSANCSNSLSPIETTSGLNRSFYCKRVIDASSSPVFPSSGLMLVRVRLLYNSTHQPITVRGHGICGRECSLPSQARSIAATGISGETQRKVNVFLLDKVVPPYFDYAIFSAGEIKK